MTTLRTLLLSAAMAFVALPGQAQTNGEKLAVIGEVPYRERVDAGRRLDYLLGQFDRLCEISPGKAPPHDMIYFVHLRLKDAGLREGIVETANTLHRISVAYQRTATSCTQAWTLYLLMRTDQGRTREEAERLLITLAGPDPGAPAANLVSGG